MVASKVFAQISAKSRFNWYLRGLIVHLQQNFDELVHFCLVDCPVAVDVYFFEDILQLLRAELQVWESSLD